MGRGAGGVLLFCARFGRRSFFFITVATSAEYNSASSRDIAPSGDPPHITAVATAAVSIYETQFTIMNDSCTSF